MSREEFEYRLETLTSRKEEERFERFCRALAEREICPNLRPQTGPTGGGDSKADADTYPVAKVIAERWYAGADTGAGDGVFAFAFSAKKQWKVKAEHDIRALTPHVSERGYTKIYFITNQFVSDKKRALAERELRKIAEVPVIILDRTWLIERVMQGRRWSCVEVAFGLAGLSANGTARLGPRDAEAESELELLDKDIADPARFENAPTQLAIAALDAALLARQLGREQQHLRARFDQAIGFARRSGQRRLVVNAIYLKAWSLYWWYDDADVVGALFDEMFSECSDSITAWDVEELTNLVSVLAGAVRFGWLSSATARLTERRQLIMTTASQLAEQPARPTDAAWARAQLTLLELQVAAEAGLIEAAARRAVASFNELLTRAEQLPEFPMTQLLRCIEVLSEIAPTSADIDALADRATEVIGRRAGWLAEARNLVERAREKSDRNEHSAVLHLLGRAWDRLYTHEGRDTYVLGSQLAAWSFVSLDLIWAARSHLILALHRMLREQAEVGEVSRGAPSVALRVAYCDVLLGRISQAMECLLYADHLAGQRDDAEQDDYRDERLRLDRTFALLVLRSEISDVGTIEVAASALGTVGLFATQAACLHVLGDETGTAMLEHVFASSTRALALALHTELPVPNWGRSEHFSSRTYVLGCEVALYGPGSVAAHEIAETVLGLTEALLAFGRDTSVIALTDRITVRLHASESLSGDLHATLLEDAIGDNIVEITYRPDAPGGFLASPEGGTALIHAALVIATAMTGLTDFSVELFQSQATRERALSLAMSYTAGAAIFGPQRLDWLKLLKAQQRTPYRRLVWWNDEVMSQAEAMVATMEPAEDEESSEPELKHSKMQQAGLIQHHLWNRAGWRGMFYAVPEDLHTPPTLGFGFTDTEAARKIFLGLSSRLSEGRHGARIHIGFVTGINRKAPTHYRVVIGPAGPDKTKRRKVLFGLMRMLTMEPTSSENLERFWFAFRRIGRCHVVPVLQDGSWPPPFIDAPPLELSSEIVRIEAWRVEVGDVNAAAIRGDDDVIVPPGETNPPYLSVKSARHSGIHRDSRQTTDGASHAG